MNVDRPALTALVLFGLLGLGFAVVALGLNREPKATPAKKEEPITGPELLPLPREVEKASRALYIAVAAPGFPPEVIEETVALPLERAFIGRPGIDSVQTHIEQGRCRLTFKLAAGRDEPQARAEAINTISKILPQLPQGIQPPVLERYDPDALPAFWIAALGDGIRPEIQISDLMRNEVRKSLLTIPGISDVELRGELQRQIRVQVSPDKLQARGLNVGDVADAIGKDKITLGTKASNDLEALVLAMPDGGPIYLRDVAAVVDETLPASIALLDGRRIVLAGVQVADGADPTRVADAVRELLNTIALPDGMILETVGNSTDKNFNELWVEVRLPVGTAREAIRTAVSKLEGAIRDRLPGKEVGSIVALGSIDGGDHRLQLLFTLPATRTMPIEEIQKRIRESAAASRT